MALAPPVPPRYHDGFVNTLDFRHRVSLRLCLECVSALLDCLSLLRGGGSYMLVIRVGWYSELGFWT
jgi:hypothetical protein